MKKINFPLLALFCLFAFAFFGCATTKSASSSGSSSSSNASSSSNTSSSSSSKVTIRLHDNCPSNTYAKAAELALRATVSDYDGVVTVSYSGRPTTEVAKEVLVYYGYCEGIKTAISKGTGESCTLSFNTSANGKGTKVKASTTDEALDLLVYLLDKGINDVYAIYDF